MKPQPDEVTAWQTFAGQPEVPTCVSCGRPHDSDEFECDDCSEAVTNELGGKVGSVIGGQVARDFRTTDQRHEGETFMGIPIRRIWTDETPDGIRWQRIDPGPGWQQRWEEICERVRREHVERDEVERAEGRPRPDPVNQRHIYINEASVVPREVWERFRVADQRAAVRDALRGRIRERIAGRERVDEEEGEG